MTPLLMLLVALLACGAHAQVTLFDLVVYNNLATSRPANTAMCTISASQLGGAGQNFLVRAGESVTVPLQATQSLTSARFTVEVFGQGPLGQGCQGCCFFFGVFGCSGKRYTTSGDFLGRLASLVGYTIRIAGNCGSQDVPKLLLEGYVTSNGVVQTQSTCVSQDV